MSVITETQMAKLWRTGECDVIVASIHDTLAGVSEQGVESLPPSELTLEQRTRVKLLVSNYSETLSQKDNIPHVDDWPQRPDEWRFEIPLKPGKKGPSAKPRRLTPTEQQEMKRQVLYLLAHGFLRPSKSRFASPTLFARKGGGTLRWCCDFRHLNEISHHSPAPLPGLRQLVDKIQTKWLTTLDMTQGFHQLRIK